jgi:DNA-directed RNA polymerase specialized sigma24 family protein
MEKVAQGTVADIHRRDHAAKRTGGAGPGSPRRLSEASEPAARWAAPDPEAEELGALVGRAVSRLPPALQEVVQDRFYAGLSLEKIATRRGCSTTYASRLVRRALADLRWMIGEDLR